MKTPITNLYFGEHLPNEECLEAYMEAAVKASLIGKSEDEIEAMGFGPEAHELTARDIGHLTGLHPNTVHKSIALAGRILLEEHGDELVEAAA